MQRKYRKREQEGKSIPSPPPGTLAEYQANHFTRSTDDGERRNTDQRKTMPKAVAAVVSCTSKRKLELPFQKCHQQRLHRNRYPKSLLIIWSSPVLGSFSCSMNSFWLKAHSRHWYDHYRCSGISLWLQVTCHLTYSPSISSAGRVSGYLWVLLLLVGVWKTCPASCFGIHHEQCCQAFGETQIPAGIEWNNFWERLHEQCVCVPSLWCWRPSIE